MSLMCRRDLFKAGLDKDYTTICNNKHPVEGELLGKDLTERLKTVRESNLASKQLTKYQTSFPKRYDREETCYEDPFRRNSGGGTNGDAPGQNTSLKIRDRILAVCSKGTRLQNKSRSCFYTCK